MYAWRENQSEATLQPTSPLPLAFSRERVIMARSADESLHVFGRLHLCKPTEKYVCTPLAVLLSGCRLRGAELLYLAVGKEDFHSRGRATALQQISAISRRPLSLSLISLLLQWGRPRTSLRMIAPPCGMTQRGCPLCCRREYPIHHLPHYRC